MPSLSVKLSSQDPISSKTNNPHNTADTFSSHELLTL